MQRFFRWNLRAAHAAKASLKANLPSGAAHVAGPRELVRACPDGDFVTIPLWKRGSVAIVLTCLGALCMAGCKPSVAPAKRQSPKVAVNSAGEAKAESASQAEGDGQVREFPVGDLPTDGNEPAPHAAESEQGWIDAEAFQGRAWTTRRLAALSPTGPIMLDLSVAVGELDLEAASEALVEQVADSLRTDLQVDEQNSKTGFLPMEWQALLQLPLIQSGWLGNLVPDNEQESQLIAMYDTNRDQKVDREEFAAFLSRGLSRNAELQISDIGEEPGPPASKSPWGRLDSNNDYSLDASEQAAVTVLLSSYDFNGDGTVSLLEADESLPMQESMGMRGSSLLDTNTLSAASAELQSEASEIQNRAAREFARDLLEHYTFLSGIPREQWRDWSQPRWAIVDANQDDMLTIGELESVHTLEADADIVLQFPSLGEEPSKSPAFDSSARLLRKKSGQENGQQSGSHPGSAEQSWFLHAAGARLDLQRVIVDLEIEDAFAPSVRSLLQQRLNMALKDSQLRAFALAQLQLKEGAFELLDENQDAVLDDVEFERAWAWLASRQGGRLMVRWMTASRPWFRLLDQNGDGRMDAREIQQAEQRLAALDADEDGLLTPNELPLVIKLQLVRSDDRLAQLLLAGRGTVAASAAELDWFAAMDSNDDGFVDRNEFLGDGDDFDSRDSNKDGFLTRQEVY
ncbi:MAG: hypothetical protein NXI32_02990 [bacterium]|nr:hypothetical protein [bacterium]